MAQGNPNPSPSTRFQPGHASIGGRPRNLFTSSQLRVLASKMFRMSVSDLTSYSEDPGIPVIDAVIGKVLLKAIEFGDAHRIEFVLNRLIGKVKDLVEEEDEDGNRQLIITRPDGSTVRLGVAPSGETKIDEIVQPVQGS